MRRRLNTLPRPAAAIFTIGGLCLAAWVPIMLIYCLLDALL